MKPKRALSAKIGGLARIFLFLATVSFLRADDASAKLVAGSTLPSLTVGTATYQNVTIRSVSARTAMITHDGGMKSILLRELPPELQQRFGYNPEADRAQEATAKAGQAAAEQQQKARLAAVKNARATARPGTSLSNIDQLLRMFGQAPDLSEGVDLRARFAELGLWVKDQGHRPSCAVFAIVSALEFQSAQANNTAERFSEEYLYWATCKTLNRQGLAYAESSGSDEENYSDAGFMLQEVATALRTYGVPQRDSVPNRYRGKTIADPTEDVIENARQGTKISVHTVPGHDGRTLAANVIHALNLGIPVPIGMTWPDTRVWRVHHLDNQRATVGNGHAVTVVGYQCKSGRIEDTVFIFKNSWGPRWGMGGYGTASYQYLAEHLHTAVVLEVQPR